MADDIEKDVRDLRERLNTLEVETRTDRRWLLIIGILLLGMLGYTNFVALPNEVASQLPDAVTEEVNREAPERVKEEISTWLKANDGEAILASIRRAQSEVSSIQARAASDWDAIRKYLQQAQNIEVGDNDCRIISGLQICWGKADLSPARTHTRAFAFRFKRKFAAKPIITDSIKGNGSAYAFAIYRSDITEEAFTGRIVEVEYKPNNAPVEFSYIAIGRPG